MDFAIHRQPLERLSRDGATQRVDRALPVEMPIAFEINGIGYAVLMASPAALDDLAYGFALSERLIDCAGDITDCDVHAIDAGVIVRITTAPHLRERIGERVRHRTTDSSCGLCGVENIEQALRPLPPVRAAFAGDTAAVFAALEQLRAYQPLNAETGAVHAAACCDTAGAIRLVREDVGRHNAFDKLIGALARAEMAWDGGFALLSSRCSYELVEKAALAGCPLLATISAPTSLAVARAQAAGLRLAVLARSDAVLLA